MLKYYCIFLETCSPFSDLNSADPRYKMASGTQNSARPPVLMVEHLLCESGLESELEHFMIPLDFVSTW